MNKIRTAIVGCGKVADFHALAYTKLPNSEFVACCDSDKTRAEAFAAKYGLTPYTDVEEMIRESHVELVSICTPHPLHAALAEKAADCGAHVMCEKPLAVTLEDCDRIIAAGERNHVEMGMIAQKRYYESSLRMKKAIEDGKIGKPIIGTVQMYEWRSKEYYESDPWRGTWKGEGGGVLANQSIHQLDILCWFMDSDIDEIYGTWENFNHPFIEVEDTAAIIVKFKSGAIATVLVSNSQNPGLYTCVHVHGDNGKTVGVQTDGGSTFIAGMTEIAEPPFNDVWTCEGEESMIEAWKQEDAKAFLSVDFMHYYHEKAIEDFLNAIAEGRKPSVTAADGRKAVELMIGVYRCKETHQPVKFPLK